MAPARFSVAAVLILASSTAFAGENVWTSNGPAGGASAIAVDPTSLALYAAGVADGREPSGVALHATTQAGVFDYEIVPGARAPVLVPRTRETRTIPARP